MSEYHVVLLGTKLLVTQTVYHSPFGSTSFTIFLTSASVGLRFNALKTSPIWSESILPSPRLSNSAKASLYSNEFATQKHYMNTSSTYRAAYKLACLSYQACTAATLQRFRVVVILAIFGPNKANFTSFKLLH